MTHPILTAIDRLSEEHHQWLFEAGEQIRRWREEDEMNGISWETPREPAQPNKRAGRNS